ncbi:MAG TPA: AI-2E family transporter [Gemmatimonadaceae bacterium]
MTKPGQSVGAPPPAVQARLIIAALAAGLFIALMPYASGLLGAAVVYVLCAPTYRRLGPRFGAKTVAVSLSVAALVLLFLPAAYLTGVAVQQAPGALGRVIQSDAFARLGTLRLGPWDAGAQLARGGEALIALLSRQALALFGGITHALLNLVIAVVGAYYLLRSRDAGWPYIRPMIPFSDAGANALRARFTSVTEATVLGIVATGLSQGATIGLSFWLVGLPNPLVWGVVTAVVSILPVLGSAIVWSPGVFVLLWSGRYAAAVTLALIGLIIASNVDNVVRPMVYRRVSGLHPLVTLVGAFAGVRLMGIAGLLLGPLAISYFFAILRIYQEEYGGLHPGPEQ